jgi:glucokinase
MAGGYAIGVDVGATKLATVLLSQDGEPGLQRSSPTRVDGGPDAVLDQIAAEVGNDIAQATGRLHGIGIGCPGIVDPATGIVRNALNLGWAEVSLVGELRRRLCTTLPIVLAKDVNALTVGERRFGAAHGHDDVVCLTIGSGFGAGIIAGGCLVEGGNHIAADLGHLSFDPAGLPCRCGGHGCLETVVSGPGLCAAFQRARPELACAGGFGAQATFSAEQVVSAAREGLDVARRALDEVASWLGACMAVCVGMVDPTAIVIGGGLGLAAYDLLVPGAMAEMYRRMPSARTRRVEVLPSALASSAIGAASLALCSACDDL